MIGIERHWALIEGVLLVIMFRGKWLHPTRKVAYTQHSMGLVVYSILVWKQFGCTFYDIVSTRIFVELNETVL